MSSPISQRQQLSIGAAIKSPVAAATNANIVLAGSQTVGGVTVGATNPPTRVLAFGQSDPTENGIYDVQTSNWTRSIDANGVGDFITGTVGTVSGGSYANEWWVLTTQADSSGWVIPDTDAMNFQVGIPALAVLGASSGASLVGFEQLGTGAVLQTLQGKCRQLFNVKDFGAIGDGSTDDSAALQAAMSALPNNSILYLDGANCLITSPFHLNGKTNVTITGGTITRSFASNTTRCGYLTSCTNVLIYGVNFIGGASSTTASVGEDDLLTIGDVVTTNASSFNKNISVVTCNFSGGLHSGCYVSGEFGTTSVVKNTNILISNCIFDSCSWGVAIYKNNKHVIVEGCIITNCGYGGMFCDTYAQGDISRPQTEANYQIYFRGNIVDTTGLVVGAGARGILMKGETIIGGIIGNSCLSIGTITSAAGTFAYLVDVDHANTGGTEIHVDLNTGDGVVGPTSADGWLIGVTQGSSNVTLNGNILTNAPNGISVEGVNQCQVLSNILSNITSAFPIEVGNPGTDGVSMSFTGIVSGNTVEKYSGNANVAIVVNSNTTACHIGVNQLSTFAYGSRLFVNSSATGVTGEQKATAFVAVGYAPGVIANGATNAATVNTLVGAQIGDIVTVAFSLDMQGCTYTGYMTATGNAQIIATNNTGGSKTLGSGTVYVSTSRSTLQD